MGVQTTRSIDYGGVPPGVPVPPASGSGSGSPSKREPKPLPREPAKFYVTSAGTTGSAAATHYELHSYPIGIVDHVLALNGSASANVRYLTDLVSPSKAPATNGPNGPGGNAPDWQSFTLSRYSPADNSNDGSGSGSGGGGAGDGDDDSNHHAALDKRLPPPALLNEFSYGGGSGHWILVQRATNDFVVQWYDGE